MEDNARINLEIIARNSKKRTTAASTSTGTSDATAANQVIGNNLLTNISNELSDVATETTLLGISNTVNTLGTEATLLTIGSTLNSVDAGITGLNNTFVDLDTKLGAENNAPGPAQLSNGLGILGWLTSIYQLMIDTFTNSTTNFTKLTDGVNDATIKAAGDPPINKADTALVVTLRPEDPAPMFDLSVISQNYGTAPTKSLLIGGQSEFQQHLIPFSVNEDGKLNLSGGESTTIYADGSSPNNNLLTNNNTWFDTKDMASFSITMKSTADVYFTFEQTNEISGNVGLPILYEKTPNNNVFTHSTINGLPTILNDFELIKLNNTYTNFNLNVTHRYIKAKVVVSSGGATVQSEIFQSQISKPFVLKNNNLATAFTTDILNQTFNFPANSGGNLTKAFSAEGITSAVFNAKVKAVGSLNSQLHLALQGSFDNFNYTDIYHFPTILGGVNIDSTTPLINLNYLYYRYKGYVTGAKASFGVELSKYAKNIVGTNSKSFFEKILDLNVGGTSAVYNIENCKQITISAGLPLNTGTGTTLKILGSNDNIFYYPITTPAINVTGNTLTGSTGNILYTNPNINVKFIKFATTSVGLGYGVGHYIQIQAQ